MEMIRVKLITVNCWPFEHEDDSEPRRATVIASDAAEAVALAQARYASGGFDVFEIDAEIDWPAPSPARVLGHAGQGPFTWGP
jgi:hypothetical protein